MPDKNGSVVFSADEGIELLSLLDDLIAYLLKVEQTDEVKALLDRVGETIEKHEPKDEADDVPAGAE